LKEFKHGQSDRLLTKAKVEGVVNTCKTLNHHDDYRSNLCMKVLVLQARAGYSALEVNLECSRVMSEAELVLAKIVPSEDYVFLSRGQSRQRLNPDIETMVQFVLFRSLRVLEKIQPFTFFNLHFI